MFSTLLIANRGEIACRVIRACQKLGIVAAGVYSDADVNARHVREADKAFRIGPAPARESYLNADAIIEAAIKAGAQAVHPGYGFLSEKVELIEACAQAGIVFVGPHLEAVRAMGSKIESKRIARASGVTCIPGYEEDDQGAERLAAEAGRIGFPLLIKASAGGGGKGMKLVRSASEFPAMLDLVRRESRAAFGDDRVLLERYIQRPRHLEVQLLGDRHGALVHLLERECSIQRNYQKVIEEAPAAHLEQSTCQRLYKAALALGHAIKYDSVGTVEFVLDAENPRTPYFLEMNTRLQVEHCVTEAVTGLDLVEHQIRVAAGQKLSISQEDVKAAGWAIEARINAEDPEEGFQASFGQIQAYQEPVVKGVRIDSGVDSRSEISPHYDSMLAKVIAHGADRKAAATRLHAAVTALRIEGIRTNQGLLREIIAHSSFDGPLSTQFLAEFIPGGVFAPDSRQKDARKAAAAVGAFFWAMGDGDKPFDLLIGFRLTRPLGLYARALYVIGEEAGEEISVELISASTARCLVAGHALDFVVDGPRGRFRHGDKWFFVRVAQSSVSVWSEGSWFEFKVTSPLKLGRAQASEDGAGLILAPMPGVVAEVLAQPGQVVARGETLMVIEAMKLMTAIPAQRGGHVEIVHVEVGQAIQKGAKLVEVGATPQSGE